MKTAIKRILCNIGMSSDCDDVIAEGMRLAWATGASLELLHVVKSLSNDVVNTLRANIRDQALLNNLTEQRTAEKQKELQQVLDDFWERHPDLKELMADRVVQLSVLEGEPVSVICHFANRGNFDMIVMAANKKSYMATYAGKVTKNVIKRAKVPVVVVPAAR